MRPIFFTRFNLSPLLSEQWHIHHHFFPGLCGQVEDKDGGGGDEDTGEDQIENVVEGFPPDDQVKCDIGIGLRTTVVINNVTSNGTTDDFPLPIWIEKRHIARQRLICDIQLEMQVPHVDFPSKYSQEQQ